MITLTFTLAGIAMLALQVTVYDSILAVRRLSQEIHETLGHDTNIYPDYEL